MDRREAFEQKYAEHRRAATAGNDGYDRHYDDSYDSRSYDGMNNGGGYEDSGFDPTNSGDDVLYDFNGSDYTGNYTASHPEHVVPSARYDEIGTPAKRGPTGCRWRCAMHALLTTRTTVPQVERRRAEQGDI